MLKEQRKRKILDLVDSQSQVYIPELAEMFHVSEMTIRRDLEELDQKGIIHRTHGGALAVERTENIIEPPIVVRSKEQSLEKHAIAKKTAGLIHDGEKIFLGSGTTTLAVAKELINHSNLTVLTNAITIVNALIPYKNIKLIVFGGFIRRAEMSMIGHFTQNALKGLQVDKVIIGMRGIHTDHGLTSDHLQELETDQAILRMSSEIIVVVDHTKFGYVAAIQTAPLSTATKIVTDSGAPNNIISRIRSSGIDVIISESE